MLTFFVILPSGCQAEDLDVGIIETGMAIHLMCKWPEAMFDTRHLFEGHVGLTGARNVNPNSAKAAALNDTKEKIKRSDKDPATMKLVINLEKQVEHNFINLWGEAAKSPSFYKIDGDSSDGPAFPTLVIVTRCMVKCATEGYHAEMGQVQDYK